MAGIGSVVALVSLLCLDGSSIVQTSGSSIPMKTIEKGAQSNVEDPRLVVVRSSNEWATLWRAHAPDRPPPSVDFSRDMIVGVFLGSRPTAGYQVEIVGARLDQETKAQGTLVVQYRVTAPPAGAVTAAVLTMPYHLVAVAARGGEVKFEKLQ